MTFTPTAGAAGDVATPPDEWPAAEDDSGSGSGWHGGRDFGHAHSSIRAVEQLFDGAADESADEPALNPASPT